MFAAVHAKNIRQFVSNKLAKMEQKEKENKRKLS